jgi:outer membrane protein OmpA-like peptidoglycan-associated protein
LKTLHSFFVLLPFVVPAQTDTLSFYFEKDVFILSTSEAEKVNWDSSWTKVDIRAYTDYLGTTSYNQALSERRAAGLRALLLEKGFPPDRIQKVEGRGELGEEQRSSLGNPKNRRVELLIYRPKSAVEESNVAEAVLEEVKDESNLSQQISEASLGEKLVLDQLLFIGGQHYITPESKAVLDNLITILKENSTLKIAIEGHICCETAYSDGFDQGTGKYNLSEARAQYIYERLVEEGIAPDRLSYRGLGRSKPLYPEERNALEQQANRRVEIRILGK